jgi:CopG family nickel-responsive transcriptional regulator
LSKLFIKYFSTLVKILRFLEIMRWNVAETTRFGISIDERLLLKFDELIEAKGYSNRSEAIRDLIRNALVEEVWGRGNEETVGTVSLVYDHHTRDLSDKLTEHQHSHHKEIISALHVHLDAHHCLEVVVLKGKAKNIKRLAEELIGTKGVKHGQLMTTTTGKGLL